MVVLVVVGAVLAAALAFIRWSDQVARVDELFRRNARDHATAIETGVRSDLEAVSALADSLSALQRVEASTFTRLAASLRDRHRTLEALEWAPRVRAEDREAMVEQARRRHPGFQFRYRDEHGSWRPSPPRAESFPIYLVEPLAGNEAALGFDPPHHPVRETALERALELDGLAISEPTPLVQSDGGQLAILAFAPVYRDGAPLGTLEERRTALLGFAEGVLAVGDLFERALSVLEPSGQDMELWDVTTTPAMAYRHVSRRAGERRPSWHAVPGHQRFADRFEIGGRTWEVVVLPHPGFYAHDWSGAAATGATVLALAIALAAHLVQRSQREARIRALVAERTSELAFRATHDPLTGMMNRSAFEATLRTTLERCRETGCAATLCYVDLDQFKVLNDNHGHAAGDQLLRELGPHLSAAVRTPDTLARLGGDEFGLILADAPIDTARAVADRLLEHLHRFRFRWNGLEFTVRASIGLTELDAATSSADSALSWADAACYIAKEKGRDRVHVFTAGDAASDLFRREMEWVDVLREALAADGFELYRQPIVATRRRSGEPDRYEVLLRLRTDSGRLVEPAAFLPAAERFGLARDIDRWVVHRVLELATASDPTVGWSVNLSGATVGDAEVARRMIADIARRDLTPGRLCLEVTETALVSNLEVARELLEAARTAGCLVALDDFGRGMSSFGYLKNLPVDLVKIDGEFVRGVATEHVNRAIVRAIQSLARTLGIRTVAESVESADDLEVLQELGVDYVQGFHLGRPVPVAEPLDVRGLRAG